MKKIWLLSFLLVGCAGAELVKTTLAPKGGVVQYKNGGFVRDKSRNMALDQAINFCKGPMKIISEEFNPDVFSLNVGGTYYTLDKNNYMYLKFECGQ